MGLTNAHHEPINFFGTSRPEGETTIIPSTWHETGLEFFGSFGKGYARFDYQAMIVVGLNAVVLVAITGLPVVSRDSLNKITLLHLLM